MNFTMNDDLTRSALVRRVGSLESELVELRLQRESLFTQVYVDPLTGLGNRRSLEEGTRDKDGFFIMCDLDGFKIAQDEHPEGHAYGDRLLQEFADFLKASVRASTDEDKVIVREGGDEFVVWCPSRDGARRITRIIRMWRSFDNAVGASAGMGKDLKTADERMYVDKQRRRAGKTWSVHH